jgi:hypothetical protein
MSVRKQLTIGAGVVVIFSVIGTALGILNIPIPLAGWGGVFVTIWILSFICLRKEWYALLASMILAGLFLYVAVVIFLPQG